ncbi:MAG: 5-(carboxyamino)imidazole ribonucleotide synthase [Actinomycetota bacterium]
MSNAGPVAKPLPTGSTVGIIGGGQLGRMLALAAARFGYRIIVLEPGPDCPAAQVANRQLVAAYDDPEALDTLAASCDVVTYEFENVPLAAARSLATRVPVRPGTEALRVAQDRLVEKEFLRAVGLATAPSAPIGQSDDVGPVLGAIGFPAIVKTRRLGYDGKGQLRLEEPGDHSGIYDELGQVPLLAEGFVDFDCEISVVVARSLSGEVRSFPPARNEHHGGILRRSRVPAEVPPETIAAAEQAAATLVKALDYVGVLGLELFVQTDGSILANEFAPRVHNSGHWTEFACPVDQFEQHIRAITGHPLGDPTAQPCEMINLIGDDVDRWPELASDDWRVHLYGKHEARPGRKMGHATRLRDVP